ncbi:MAG: hypothetical protein ABI612_11995 [Betaproteobacteria bacterium]
MSAEERATGATASETLDRSAQRGECYGASPANDSAMIAELGVASGNIAARIRSRTGDEAAPRDVTVIVAPVAARVSLALHPMRQSSPGG